MWRRWPLLLALLGPSWTGMARATHNGRVDLTFEGVAGCPSENEVRADVDAQVPDPPNTAIRIQLRVNADGTTFSGDLVAVDATGTREHPQVRGRTCAEVAHALAFQAALEIELAGRREPDAAALPPAISPEASAPPQTDPARRVPSSAISRPLAQSPARLPDAPSRPIPSAPSVAVIALGRLQGGFAPAPSPAAELGFEIEHRTRRVFAPSALVALVGGASHLNQPEGSADLSWLGGDVLVCPVRLEGDALSLRPCLGVEIGAVYASGNTAIDPRIAIEPMASLDGILRLRWLVTARFFVEAQATASLELLRTRYFFEPDQTIYVVSPVTGRGAIGLGVHLQ